MKYDYSGLESLLEVNGLSKTSLVKKAGISTNVVVSISKQEKISMDALILLCRFFCCDASDIFSLIFEEEDYVSFRLSVISEMLSPYTTPRIKVEYENGMFCFYGINRSGEKIMMGSFRSDGIPMSRSQEKESLESFIRYVVTVAERTLNK